jgi:hypothetical protein
MLGKACGSLSSGVYSTANVWREIEAELAAEPRRVPRCSISFGPCDGTPPVWKEMLLLGGRYAKHFSGEESYQNNDPKSEAATAQLKITHEV